MKVRLAYYSIEELPEDRVQGLQNLDWLKTVRFNVGEVPTGTEFIVYGITLKRGNVLYDLSQYPDELYVFMCLAALFDIVDSRVSKYWECRTFEDGSFVFWPPSWFSDSYHDRLSDGDPALVKDWDAIKALIKAEHSS